MKSERGKEEKREERERENERDNDFQRGRKLTSWCKKDQSR